jgi:hypothetical protein
LIGEARAEKLTGGRCYLRCEFSHRTVMELQPIELGLLGDGKQDTLFAPQPGEKP